jgi:hypothetical protein
MSKAAAALIMTGALVATPCYAQMSGRTVDGQTPDGWRGSITPYLWLAGPKGTLASLPDGPSSEFDAAFKDVLTHLSSAFVGKGEIGYGKFGLLGDVSYIKIVADKDIGVGELPRLGAKVAVKSTMGSLLGYYRVYDSPRYTLDLMAGAAYNSGGLALDLSSAGGAAAAGHASKSWTDPVVGARAIARLTKRSSLSVTFDVGGASTTSVDQIVGAYNFQLNQLVTLSAGYRYYAVDFKNEAFRYNLDLGGPIVAATFNF